MHVRTRLDDDAVLLEQQLLHGLRAVAKHARDPVREGLWSCRGNEHEWVQCSSPFTWFSSISAADPAQSRLETVTVGASLTQLPQF